MLTQHSLCTRALRSATIEDLKESTAEPLTTDGEETTVGVVYAEEVDLKTEAAEDLLRQLREHVRRCGRDVAKMRPASCAPPPLRPPMQISRSKSHVLAALLKAEADADPYGRRKSLSPQTAHSLAYDSTLDVLRATLPDYAALWADYLPQLLGRDDAEADARMRPVAYVRWLDRLQACAAVRCRRRCNRSHRIAATSAAFSALVSA